MTGKIKFVAEELNKRGHDHIVIAKYIKMLETEKELDEFISYLKKHPNTTKNDINHEVFRIYLRKRNINL